MSFDPLFVYRGSGMRGFCGAWVALVVCAGCSTYDSVTQRIVQSITPYRITIVQGNFVSQEAAAQMRVGMTRAQAKALLGTPLLTDMFHADRWDYVFYFKRGSTSVVQQRDFIVYFNNDNVVSWAGGDDLPSNLELLADIDGDKQGKKTAVALPVTGASAVTAAAPPALARDNKAGASLSDTPAVAVGSFAASAANAQAAQAANRATSQVSSTPNANATPSVRSNVPQPAGTPAGAPAGEPQFQFRRSPAPSTPDGSEPVGPGGSS